MATVFNRTMRAGKTPSSRLPEAPATQEPMERVVISADRPLLLVTIALLIFGLVAVYTATAHQAMQESGSSLSLLFKQVIAVIGGIVAMVVCSRISFLTWRKLTGLLVIVSIILLCLTLAVGTTANGSERWIALPFGFQFQPSEIAKVAAICVLARVAAMPKNTIVDWAIHLIPVGLMVGLIYLQPNLSVTLILAFMSILMMFVSGFNWVLLASGLPFAAYAVSVKIQDTEYQRRRIQGWLDPWKDPLDTGYNLIQSYYAIGSGGLFGVGLGNSIQKLYYLPFQHTDFIFAVICEELGFIGAAILLGLFATLGWRGFSIALNCPHRFGQMLAFGLTSTILLQAGINICVTTGIMPVTGVTLPLISYGGTSMILTLGMIGILLNISTYQTRTD